MKVCTKCLQELPSESFHKGGRDKDGLQPQCKKCTKGLRRLFYISHSEEIKERVSYYRRAHPEKIKASKMAYSLAHKDHIKAKNDEWYAAHPEEIRAYYQTNLQRILAQKVIYRKSAAGKANSAKQHNKRRARFSNIITTLTAEEWENIKKQHKYKCVYCGERKVLAQDHIIPISKGGHHVKENIIPACQSCNSKKRDKTVLLQILAQVEVICP